MIDARTPVIVGVGHASQRNDDPRVSLEPVDLLADAVRAAAVDSGARRSLAQSADAFAVVDMLSWRYPDPGALLARRLGASPRVTLTSTVGGNSPQLLVNEAAAAIQRGEHRVVVVGGAECMYSRRRARKEPKRWLEWMHAEDPPCPIVVGDPRGGTTDDEMAHLALAPTDIYPLFETALRADAGRTVDEHQRAIGELWSHFAAVAAENPHAWSRTAYTPTEISTPSPDNRVVSFPYLKRMCANLDVDQAAAIVLCSYEAARELGVPDDRMVFPLVGADAHDHFHVTQRWSLADSPAIGIAVRSALGAIHRGVDDVARFDLYSCFPSAVEMAMAALGLRGPSHADTRPLTTTGGLPFAGGPGNNYSAHGIARMVEACRQDPGSLGLVTALGWYVTKHSTGCYSTTPPEHGFVRVDRAATQAEVDVLAKREPAGSYSGEAVVEATSVVFDRGGSPVVAILALITPDGRRAWANTSVADALFSMTAEPWEGRSVRVSTDGSTNMIDL